MSDLTAIANLSILLVEPSEVQQKLIKKSLAQCGVTQIETGQHSRKRACCFIKLSP